MESHEELEKLPLSEIDFFSRDQLLILESYNINTLAQLLGSTKGFKIINIFQELDPSGQLLENLIDLVPDELIETYQSYSSEHKTGLLKDLDYEEAEEECE